METPAVDTRGDALNPDHQRSRIRVPPWASTRYKRRL